VESKQKWMDSGEGDANSRENREKGLGSGSCLILEPTGLMN
jgi:hypothetical protein